MKALDDFSTYYEDFLDGTYDCIDRIVLNAYFIMAQSNGGFRTWWRRLALGDDNLEFSRNLLFKSGRIMDQVFHNVIDRTRGPLDIKTVKTIFGYKHRPFKCRGKSFKCGRKSKPPRFEVVVEKPVYNLTVFKVHFGKITIRMYSKGEHVLRIEVVVHNTKALGCGKVIERFGRIVDSLKAILERFLSVLRSVDVSFIDIGKLESWPLGSKVGSAKVGGVDIAVML